MGLQGVLLRVVDLNKNQSFSNHKTMKKDIQIPIVKDVYVAIVNEYNDIYKTQDWNAYIINDKNVDLDMVLIVTSGYSEDKTTSVLEKNWTYCLKKVMLKLNLCKKIYLL